ncbi:50S ribosomal protein L10 [Patescibacteria group bacterium]|nr:50S ribosomal protein L10 [Patescibacteria group bacterium]
MAKSRKQKEALVQELTDVLKESKAYVLSDYRGMTVSDVQDLRKRMKEKSGTFMVVKNSLFKIAAKNAGLDEEFYKNLVGPVALTVSSEDEVASAKETFEFAKECKALEIKEGFLEGNVLKKEDVESLAKLPTKQELIAKVVGTINAPLSGLVTVLSGNSRKMVQVLKAIADQKS